ncbi:MAG: DarT ssDNA thymidine ADP-ribosyltransferase family protein [Mobilitalea sp.]
MIATDENNYYLCIAEIGEREIVIPKTEYGKIIFERRQEYELAKAVIIPRNQRKIDEERILRLIQEGNNEKEIIKYIRKYIKDNSGLDGVGNNFVNSVICGCRKQKNLKLCNKFYLLIADEDHTKIIVDNIVNKSISEEETTKRLYNYIRFAFKNIDLDVRKGKRFLCIAYMVSKIKMIYLTVEEIQNLILMISKIREVYHKDIGKYLEEFYQINIQFKKLEELNSILTNYPGFEDRYKRSMEIRAWNREVYDYLKSRGVNYLVHFTNYENIESIFEYGIRSRYNMNFNGIRCKYNDDTEGVANYISTSVEFPNYLMRYGLEVKNGTRFSIIQIKIEVILEQEIQLYLNNANTRGEHPTCYYEALFSNENRSPDIPTCFTTNPQAEIKVKEYIPVKFFQNIFVQNEEMQDYVQKIAKKNEFDVSKVRLREQFYGYRKDYKQWKKEYYEYGTKDSF